MKLLCCLFLLCVGSPLFAQINNSLAASGTPGLARSVGASRINIFARWRDIQQRMNSPLVWKQLDSQVIAAEVLGLDPFITLVCTNPISALDTTPGNCAYFYDNNVSSSDQDNRSAWFPEDSALWKTFLRSIVDRYDHNGSNDAPGLLHPVASWHIEQEWSRIWCSKFADTSIEFVSEFVRYVNMTYREIKRLEPVSKISYAGLDGRHDQAVFLDGYYNGDPFCVTVDPASEKPIMFATPSDFRMAYPKGMIERRNSVNLLRNALADQIDIHQYGRWQTIPNLLRWLRDTAFLGSKEVVFFEGGGPYCKTCESIYHPATDTNGVLPPDEVRDNASYVVYYILSGLANNVRVLSWHIGPEYKAWGAAFGDLDLMTISHVPKPSFYTFRYLSSLLASDAADSVVAISEGNNGLYHYKIEPRGTDVYWSMNANDEITIDTTARIIVAHIPTVFGDSIISADTITVRGKITVPLHNRVPVIIDIKPLPPDERVANDDQFQLSMQLSPNPSTNILQVSYTILNSSEVVLVINDMLGNQLTVFYDQLSNAGYFSRSIDLRSLQAGTYTLLLKAGGNFVTQRFIVVR